MNTIALVQMAREFAECGREDEAQRVMDEACDELAEPVRETAAASGQSWGGFTFANVIRRVQMVETLKEFERKEWRTFDELPELLRQIDECMDRAKSLTMWQSSFNLPRRVGKVGGVLSRELWRATQ